MLPDEMPMRAIPGAVAEAGKLGATGDTYQPVRSAPAAPPAGLPISPTSPVDVSPPWLERPTTAIGTLGSSTAQATVSAVGATLKALAALPSDFKRSQLDVMDRIDRGEDVRRSDDKFNYWNMAPDQRRAFRAMADPQLQTPVTEVPLYKTGQQIDRYGRKHFPLTKEQRDSLMGEIGSFVGGAAPAVAATIAGSAVGFPEAGLLLGATQAGLQSAGAEFDRAMAAGAGEQQAAQAAGLHGLVAGTLQALPLGAVMRPVTARAPGVAAWAQLN
jgi:hypothetical protein